MLVKYLNPFSLFVAGLPQYFVFEAKDTDHTEGEEDSRQAGVKEADAHWAWRVQTPLQCIPFPICVCVCVLVYEYGARKPSHQNQAFFFWQDKTNFSFWIYKKRGLKSWMKEGKMKMSITATVDLIFVFVEIVVSLSYLFCLHCLISS